MNQAIEWIDNATAPLRAKMAEGVQAIGDSIVGAFDKFMTRMVNEGGLGELAKSVGNGVSNFKAVVKEHLPDFSHGLGKSGLQEPNKKLGLSAQKEQNIASGIQRDMPVSLNEQDMEKAGVIKENLSKWFASQGVNEGTEHEPAIGTQSISIMSNNQRIGGRSR